MMVDFYSLAVEDEHGFSVANRAGAAFFGCVEDFYGDDAE